MKAARLVPIKGLPSHCCHESTPDPFLLANKIDLPEAAENLVHFKERFKRIKVHPVSAETGEGLDKLRKWLDEKIGQKYEK